MDLCEYENNRGKRHPWEIARANGILNIIRMTKLSINSQTKVLDIGCGDGFAVNEIFNSLNISHIDAFDPNLTKDQVTIFSDNNNNINFTNSLSSLEKENYDIITLFDVIEHTDNDHLFLDEILDYAAPGAVILLTAPAFNCLYSSHDTFLSHYRRYSRTNIRRLLGKNNLLIINSGYLFFSLLIVRLITVLLDKIPKDPSPPCRGVSTWSHGLLMTKGITSILTWENKLLTKLSSKKLTLPGLSVWVICKKPL